MNHIIALIDIISYGILILIGVVVLELILIALIRHFIDRNHRL